jgi:deoxyhypusine synthase
MLNKPVKDIKLKKGMPIDELMKEFDRTGGFQAKELATGTNILERMIKDKKCLRLLSFPANLLATGTRGVIREMVKRKWFDLIITTSGTLDHDLARIWKPYYHGSFGMDDKKLHREQINRLGNVLIPYESYGKILEEKLQPILDKIWEKRSEEKKLSSRELTSKIGKQLEKEERKEESILYWAFKKKIPIYIPGPTDGAVGSQLWLFYQSHRDFQLDLLRDEQELSDWIWEADRLGGLIIGGGISKHHLIWWAQFKGGLDYGVYLTAAQEWDGSLSGAKLKEAISWGKLKESAKEITIQGDATLLLPLMIGALIERL